MATKEIEIWAVVDENGDYGVGHDDTNAREDYENGIQPMADAAGIRSFKVTLTVPLPQVVELTGEVKAEEEIVPELTAK